MGSKLTVLLGLLTGAVLTYFCYNQNIDKLSSKYAKLQQNKTKEKKIATVAPPIKQETTTKEVKEEPKVEIISQPADAYFEYSLANGSSTSLRFPTKSKNKTLEDFLYNYCPSERCKQNLIFDDNTTNPEWISQVLKIASFLKDKNVKDGKISIKKEQLEISGEFQNEKDKISLESMLKALSEQSINVENLTTLSKKEIQQKEDAKQEKKELKNINDEISKLLKMKPIYFKFNSSQITQDSKRTLDSIIKLLSKVPNIPLVVSGHTDSKGKASYNKRLSQKRAESVKRYLQNNLNEKREIKAVGYGEERPITQNPRDEINRRVEIELVKGE